MSYPFKCETQNLRSGCRGHLSARTFKCEKPVSNFLSRGHLSARTFKCETTVLRTPLMRPEDNRNIHIGVRNKDSTISKRWFQPLVSTQRFYDGSWRKHAPGRKLYYLRDENMLSPYQQNNVWLNYNSTKTSKMIKSTQIYKAKHHQKQRKSDPKKVGKTICFLIF